MNSTPSLRLRLLVLILTPLAAVAVVLGVWRYTVAQETAEAIFDRSLLATAFAISRDVMVSDGDALSLATRDLMNDASGGEVFYHVTSPGGVYVTGYAYPPQIRNETGTDDSVVYGEAVYRDEPVRVVRLTERVSVGNLTGDFRVTVWQRVSERHEFARAQAVRSLRTMASLLIVLAVLVWFGVAWGLRPLADLEAAVEARSPADMSPIRRAVPPEVRGLTDTLNQLFTRVDQALSAHQVFISDAAHQLRNPAGAVLLLAETAQDARTDKERSERVDDLVDAARHSARLTEQLLSLERLRYDRDATTLPAIDVCDLLEEVCAAQVGALITQGIEFELDIQDRPLFLRVDPLHLSEAVKNLIDNAHRHGGEGLSRIQVMARRDQADVLISVQDDGIGLDPAHSELVFKRFGQLGASSGSGLGLSIVAEVARHYGGSAEVQTSDTGARLALRFPAVDAADV